MKPWLNGLAMMIIACLSGSWMFTWNTSNSYPIWHRYTFYKPQKLSTSEQIENWILQFYTHLQSRAHCVWQRAQPIRGGDQADVDGQLDWPHKLRGQVQRSQVGGQLPALAREGHGDAETLFRPYRSYTDGMILCFNFIRHRSLISVNWLVCLKKCRRDNYILLQCLLLVRIRFVRLLTSLFSSNLDKRAKLTGAQYKHRVIFTLDGSRRDYNDST